MTELKTVAERMFAIQQEITEPVKGSINPHFKNRYVDLPSLMAHLRPLLNKHGLLVRQMCDVKEGKFVLRTEVVCINTDEQDSIDSFCELPTGCKPQDLGSAITYARRYSLCAMFGISGEDDDDGQAASHPPKQAVKPAVRQEAAAPLNAIGDYDTALAAIKQCKTKQQLQSIRARCTGLKLSAVEKQTLAAAAEAVLEREAIRSEGA